MLQRLGSAVARGMPWLMLPVPSHVLMWASGSRESKPGDEGCLGVAVCTGYFISLMGGVWAALSSGEAQGVFARAESSLS